MIPDGRYRIYGHWSEIVSVTCGDCDQEVWADEGETRSFDEMLAAVEAHELAVHR